MWKWLSAATAAVEPDKGNAATGTPRRPGNPTESPRFAQTAGAAGLRRLDEGKSPVVQVTDRICAFVFGENVQALATAAHRCKLIL